MADISAPLTSDPESARRVRSMHEFALTMAASGAVPADQLGVTALPLPVAPPAGRPQLLVQPVAQVAARTWQRLVHDAVDALADDAAALTVDGPAQDRAAGALRVEAVSVLLGLLGLTGLVGNEAGTPAAEDPETLLRVAVGAEPPVRLIQQVVLGRPGPDLPLDGLGTLGDALASPGCAAVREAVAGYCVARTGAALRPTGTIASHAPARAQEGATVSLFGTGFDGAAVVMVTTDSGGSLVHLEEASPTRIAFRAPPGISSGPIGAYCEPAAVLPGELAAAVEPLCSALLDWLGVDPRDVAADLVRRLEVPPLVMPVEHLLPAGPPRVLDFTVAGRSASVDARPGQEVTLRWSTEGADHVEILTTGGVPPVGPVTTDGSGNGEVTVALGNGPAQGLFTLDVVNDGGQVLRSVDVRIADRVAFALGGGGSRGAFQLGALRWLDDQGIRPDALATTSVGSINGLQLAHGVQGQERPIVRLERIWLDEYADGRTFFAESELTTVLKAYVADTFPGGLEAFQSQVVANAVTWSGVGAAAGLVVLGPLGLLGGLLSGAAGSLANDMAQLGTFVKGFLSLVAGFTTDGPNLPIGILPVTPRGRSGLFTLDPIRGDVARHLDAGQVAGSGIDLRMLAVALDDGRVVALDERGRVWAGPPSGGPLAVTADRAPLTDGAIASSAMPALMEHEPIGPWTCVDGGVRDVVPVEVAIRDLGASTVYAVACSAPIARRPGADQMAMMGVFGRAIMDIVFDEMSRNDVAPSGGWPRGVDVRVVQPTFNLYDPMVFEPALVRIAYDYGRMRASDLLSGATPDAGAVAQCDLLVRARVQAWKLERLLYGQGYWDPDRDPFSQVFGGGFVPGVPPNGVVELQVATHLRAVKRDIRDACRARVGLHAHLPAGFEAWFQGWEKHGNQGLWNPPDASPWGTLVPASGHPIGPEAVPTM